MRQGALVDVDVQDRLAPGVAATLSAVLHLWVEGDRLTTRAIAGRAGVSLSRAHEALVELHERGLVNYPAGAQGGAICPTVAVGAL